MKYRIAVLDMAPSHYRTPIYSKVTNKKIFDSIVYFSSNYGSKKTFVKEFNKKIKWENDLSQFNHKFLKNYYFKKDPFPPKGMWNFGIIKEILKNKFDAIVAVSYTPLSHKLAMIAAKISGTPIIFKEEADLLKQPKGIKGKIKKILIKLIVKNSDAFLYGYSENKKFYEYFRAKKNQLFFFPCAVNNEMFQKQKKELPSKNTLKKKIGFSSKDFVGIFIGRLIGLKNVLHLIKATEKLQQKGIPAGLIVVGDGPERTKLEEYVKKNKVKKIRFIGFKQQKELAEYIKAADVSLLASSEDRSPKSLNETMNFGLPAIVTDAVATAPDLVKKGKTGFIYPVGNIEKLSEYIEKLYKNKELYRSISKNVNKIIKKWSFNKDIKGLTEAIKYVKKNNNKK